MDTATVTLQVPASLYADLQSLGAEEQVSPVEMIARLVDNARQHRAWLRGWEELRELIQREGGLQVGVTKKEVVEQMRKTRYEIFEAEYAHLYR
jgi:hypothetical protein